MNSRFVYRASFYAMLLVSALVLSGQAASLREGALYPILVTAGGAAALLLVDHYRVLALPRRLADVLALCTLGYFYFEYRADDAELPRALGHWLTHLQLIKYFLPKNNRDDWVLFLLGLTEVLIGSVVNESDEIGGWIFLWAMLAVWVLGQFFLQREARRAQAVLEPGADEAAAGDLYTGLYDLPYAFDTFRVMISTLALGGLIFLALPRQAGAGRNQGGSTFSRHLTGFDDEVKLGQLGEILENDSVVMTVELSDAEGRTIHPEDDLLFRGATMILYDKTRWRRQPHRPQQTVVSFPAVNRVPARRLINQKIKLEPNDSATVFAIRPVVDVDSEGRLPPNLNPLDGTLFRPDSRGGAYDYEVVSDADPDAPQMGEEFPSDFRREEMLSLPRKLKQALRAIALPVVKGIPADGVKANVARARALERFLRESGEFSYSLKMDVVDPDLDPVEDFLKNRRKGHCEYFASALALLLRSIDIPSRMVNGFKGGDWNEITQTLNVRQKHAHSWVEAYVGGTGRGERAPLWLTLDPTPVAGRNESIAQVGGVAGQFRSITDVFRHVWIFYIVGYDGDRQERILYHPMIDLARELRNQYARLGRLIRGIFASLFQFRDLSSLISVRGFLATFTLLASLLVLARLVRWIYGLIVRWLKLSSVDEGGDNPGVLFYRRLAQLLARYHLERGQTETQREFAARAAIFLAARAPETRTLVDAPRQVVDAFYRVWFGQRELSPEDLQALDRKLDELEASLKTP